MSESKPDDRSDMVWDIASRAKDQGAVMAAIAALRKVRRKTAAIKAAIPLLEQAAEDIWTTWTISLEECTKVHR